MSIFDLVYIWLLTSSLGKSVVNNADTGNTQPPDIKPLTDYITGYGLAILSGVLTLVSLFLTFTLVKIGFRISKAASDGDVEGRSSAIKDIIWAAVGAGIVFSATVAAGIFAGIFLNK